MAVFTYRPGAYVVDTRRGQLGEIVEADEHGVRLRAPGGGGEWRVTADVLRLAHSDELKQARAAARGEWVAC